MTTDPIRGHEVKLAGAAVLPNLHDVEMLRNVERKGPARPFAVLYFPALTGGAFEKCCAAKDAIVSDGRFRYGRLSGTLFYTEITMREGLEIFDQIRDALAGVLGETDRRLQRADDALLDQTEIEVSTHHRLRETNERLTKALEMLRELRAATEKVIENTDAEMLRIEGALGHQIAVARTLSGESTRSDQSCQERQCLQS